MDKKNITKHNQLVIKSFQGMNRRSSMRASFDAFSQWLASLRWLKGMAIVLLPVLVLLKYPVDQKDYDFWWQMALGKYYLTHHTIMMDQSVFSWTPTDPTWVYNTFLGSIFIYFFYNLMGGFGLWIFQWLIFLTIFLLFYLFLRLIRQKLDVTGVTIIAAVAIASAPACSYYKPELFSALLFGGAAFILFWIKLTRRKFLLYLYPLILLFWVNLHGAFIMGLAMLVAFFLGEILNRKSLPEESFSDRELTHLGVATILSFMVTLLNPYGIHYLLNILKGIFSDNYNINSRYIQAYVTLWPYLKEGGVSFFRLGQTAWILFIMMLFLLCLFLYEFIKKRSCDVTLLFISMATFWGSMRAVRAAYLFAIFFFFSFFYLLSRLKLKDVPGRATLVSLIVFVFFFMNISYFTFRYHADNKWFGAGLESFVPVKEVSFLKQHRLEGPIFNDYVVGGYLIWALYPDYKVFIDPRLGPYSKQVAPDYWALTSVPVTGEAITRFRDRYPFNIAILHFRELPLIFDLLQADWRLLYFEKNAAILIHESRLSAIPPEVQFIDLGPLRFKDVKNPEVLLNVFSIYVNLNENPASSRVIYNIYKKNISDCYKLKEEHLRMMDNEIRRRESEL